ncbi:hypothetical protein ACWT_4582 [Actinoplanes sp. SE50]|nr:hypothetical protein ACPL_4713 [Actinoplanes sp. SE50/110]ATO83997.1 hypothetical protein ACWT_4582 [Actinoplanes sp. SE50]
MDGRRYSHAVDVDWNAELVDQLESHWHAQLRPRLNGLTDDEYFWQPVPGCWTLSRRGSEEFVLDYAHPLNGPAPVTTIAWRLAHLLDVFGPPATPHFEGSPGGQTAMTYPGTAAAALRQLDGGHDAWVRDLRSLGATGIIRAQGAISPPEYAEAPMAKLILHTHREVIHHGAEICLLRDLYLGKGGLSGL